MSILESESLAFDLRVVDKEVNLPDPGRTGEFISRIHYLLEDSLADLIDNSIDAHASHVHIRLFRNAKRFVRLTIADDGSGMDLETLRLAMKYGARTPHKSGDLGKYGVGMKTASFNQSKSLSVLTMQQGKTNAWRWTLASMGSGWECEILDSKDAARVLVHGAAGVKIRENGTVIVWDKLECLQAPAAELEALTSRVLNELDISLGIRFHRFLESGALSVTIDVYHMEAEGEPIGIKVASLDPFGYERSGAKGYPLTFKVELGEHQKIELDAHVWPPKSEAPGYKLGVGKVASRQGFYIYRNDRLIQIGGWLGLRANDSEPHSSLARVSVDLPPEMDGLFGLNVQKTSVKAPSGFKDAVENSQAGGTKWEDYLRCAEDVYRDRGKIVRVSNVVPGAGIPSGAQKKISKSVAVPVGQLRPISFDWVKMDEDRFFEVDLENDEIRMNKGYREKVLERGKASGADAALVKTLLFALVRSQFDKERNSTKQRRQVEGWNEMILKVLRGL
jgi:hypothetical protein